MASPIRAPLDIEPLGNIGGLLTPREDFVPNIQSVYGDIIQNAPDYQYFTAPLSNQGRTTATYGGQNNIVVAPDTPVRVVDNATGQVVYSGVGYEGAQGAIDAANALSASTGKKANWDIQVAGPTMQGFQSVSTDRPDVSGLGILADVALPVAGSLLAGPLGLGALGLGAAGTAAAGAAIGSGLSSAAQGRSLEDALLRAAIAGGGSYLGSQIFAPTPTTGGINADLVPGALAGKNALNFGSIASEAIPAGVGGAATSGLSDIIVTALGGVPVNLAGAFGPLATSLLPSVFDAAQLNNMATVDQTTQPTQPDELVVTAQVPTATTPALTVPGILPPTTTTSVPPPNPAEDIVATAQTQTQPVTPTPVILPPTTPTNIPPPNPAEDIVATAQTQTQPVTPTPVVLPPTTTTPTAPAPDPTEDIRVTAPKDTQVVTPPAIPPVFLPPTTTPPATTPTDTTPPAKKDDFLGTGLSLSQLAAITGLSLTALQSLLGGGSGSTPTTPYVSPFGSTGGLLGGAAGTDFRATPAITDYERYGFGPEATFFRPEYSQLTSGAMAPATTNSPSDISQIYRPLI